MARIKEKVKAGKVVSTVWNWVVFGVLAAVVVAGIVLGIIAIVDHFSNEEQEEKTGLSGAGRAALYPLRSLRSSGAVCQCPYAGL